MTRNKTKVQTPTYKPIIAAPQHFARHNSPLIVPSPIGQSNDFLSSSTTVTGTAVPSLADVLKKLDAVMATVEATKSTVDSLTTRVDVLVAENNQLRMFLKSNLVSKSVSKKVDKRIEDEARNNNVVNESVVAPIMEPAGLGIDDNNTTTISQESPSPINTVAIIATDIVATSAAVIGKQTTAINLPAISNVNGNEPVNKPVFEITDTIIAAAPKRNWIYVSNLPVHTKSEDIIKYIAAKFYVESKFIRCLPLTKSNVDIGNLDFISFRVGVVGDVINALEKKTNWPSGIVVRKFQHNNSKNGKRQAPFNLNL